MSTADELKQTAALAALEKVEPGMRLGLGSGSTAAFFVKGLGERVRAGLDIIGVPTSERTAALARAEGIALTTLDETPELDLTIDGADELDASLRLIKGGGGALLREKIVASSSQRMLVIADGSKLVGTLGAFGLPIEVNLFGLRATWIAIEKAAARIDQPASLKRRLAADGTPFVTDGGHAIIDASFGLIRDPEGLSLALAAIPGVVEHGLFLGIATSAVIASPEGVRWLSA